MMMMMIYIYIYIYNALLRTHTYIYMRRGGHLGVMVKAIDCRIVVSKFEVQSCYYVHFRTKILWKGMFPFILFAMDKIVPLLFF